jgi:uncharacterized membrane protein
VSDRRLGLALALLALAGLGISGYLIYIHYAGVKPICTGGGGCERVQTSRYAELAGIPVAVLGAVGYGLILAASQLHGEGARIATAVLALAGFGFSAYLTYRELFTIDAICQWCVASAVLMTALAVVSSLRLLRAPAAHEAAVPQQPGQ